jgi:hypothetical protein
MMVILLKNFTEYTENFLLYAPEPVGFIKEAVRTLEEKGNNFKKNNPFSELVIVNT